jgi:hypothetical protein
MRPADSLLSASCSGRQQDLRLAQPRIKKGLNQIQPYHAGKLLEAATRFELVNGGFADLCLTTWLCRPYKKNGAGNGI